MFDGICLANLCLQAFALATDVLRKGGWFVTKVFRSRDYEPLKWVLSQFFKTVRPVKPEASRMESAEIFLVGQFYKAPDRIDPRFLDSRHVFGEIEVEKDRSVVVSSLLRECKRKRKAEGYADGDILYHELRVSDFLQASDPLEALAKANKVVLDLKEVESHPLTTEAVKADMEDIQVLGKADIKNLLKWRKKILAELNNKLQQDSPVLIETQPNKPVESELLDEEELEDLKIEEDIQRLLSEEAKVTKKRLKRVRKVKMKLAERLVLKMEHPGDRIEQEDEELFSLATLHDLAGLQKANQLIGDTSKTGVDDLVRAENVASLRAIRAKRDEEEQCAVKGAKQVHFERRGDAADVPGHLKDMDVVDRPPTRDDLCLSSDEDNSVGDATLKHTKNANISDSSTARSSQSDSEPEKQTNPKQAPIQSKITVEHRTELPKLSRFNLLKNKRNPLLVDLDDSAEEIKEKRKIQCWLKSEEMKSLLNPLDVDISADEMSNSDSSETETANKKLTKKAKKVKKRDHVASTLLASTMDRTSVLVNQPSDKPPASSTKSENVFTDTNQTKPSAQRLKRLRRPLTSEEQALALRLVRSAKSRRELLESAYHRMQFFEDPSELPDWFVEDEQKHMRKPLPLTEKELPVDRPTMGRTLNKVEEAKARKKARLAKRLKRIRQKAEHISDDVPETEKWQQIKQMYKKAGLLNKKRRPLHVIVNTKAGVRNPTKPLKGSKIKIVDRRMKADLRGQARAAGKGRKRGKSGGRPIRLLAHKPRKGGIRKRKR
ncbi:AdoMet-dependent rRNA methyltransferase SPB1 [Paragonimus heterotremus]|uniref:AdoMet-dependent rRNA methyltransferase SPB1 n=1 Tax=Paragonimus heterotremus TaxID=100268 RepID=A0A8J4T9R9_9TREM|nr:AdoMet-dependent rRNA methyltransferase SPB1 [Paragonimus heterotremus]